MADERELIRRARAVADGTKYHLFRDLLFELSDALEARLEPAEPEREVCSHGKPINNYCKKCAWDAYQTSNPLADLTHRVARLERAHADWFLSCLTPDEQLDFAASSEIARELSKEPTDG
jgi:hypothetical protein